MEQQDEARRRIHQLLLSGDNTLKNRDDEGRQDRARARFAEARRVAEEAGLTDALVIIDRRLELLGEADGPA
ncbi:MAG: hypothetical protein AB7V62_05065 [Thermoleophilia bacterium]